MRFNPLMLSRKMTLGLFFSELVLWSGNSNSKGQQENCSFFILKKMEAASAFFLYILGVLYKHCGCITRLGSSWDIGMEAICLPYPDVLIWDAQPGLLYTCNDADFGVLSGTFKSNGDMPVAVRCFQDIARHLSTFLYWIFNIFFFLYNSQNYFFLTCWVPAPHSLQIVSSSLCNGGWRGIGAKSLPCTKKLD